MNQKGLPLSEGREDSVGILRRKVRTAGNAPAPIARAARRAADLALDLDLRVTEIEETKMAVPQAVTGLPEPILLVRYRMASTGASCLFALDPGLFTAIGEQTTLAMVSAKVPEPRKPTRVDMAMCAPFLDAFLLQLDEEAPNASLTHLTRSAQDPLMLANLAEAEMILPDRAGAFFRITVEAGGREGRLFVLIPELSAAASEEAAWRSKLDAAVLPAQGEVEAILCRLPLTIERLKSLSVGDQIAIPATAIAQVSLEGPDGTKVTTARLGQLEGHRAVCINGSGAAPPGGFDQAGAGALEGPGGGMALPNLTGDEGQDQEEAPPPFEMPEGGLMDLPEPEAPGDLGELPDLGGDLAVEPIADLGQFGDLADLDAIPGASDKGAGAEPAEFDFASVNLEDL